MRFGFSFLTMITRSEPCCDRGQNGYSFLLELSDGYFLSLEGKFIYLCLADLCRNTGDKSLNLSETKCKMHLKSLLMYNAPLTFSFFYYFSYDRKDSSSKQTLPT